MTNLNTGHGFSNEAAGIAKVIQVMRTLKKGNMRPMVHLNVLNPHIPHDDDENTLTFLTETLEFRQRAAFTGIMGYGTGGSNAFATLCGEMREDLNYAKASYGNAAAGQHGITYWQGGGGQLPQAAQPRRDYYIMGTMSNWEPQVMTTRRGREDRITYTLTLGENRWEMFQICLDGDPKRCLYPGSAMGAVEGPEDNVDRQNSWILDGRPGYVWTEGGEMEEIHNADTGLIGATYNIILRICGEFRTVEWEKVEMTEKDQEAISEAALKGSEADYFLYTFSGDELFKMSKDSSAPGRYDCVVRLDKPLMFFQIVRSEDWSQVIYPAEPAAASDTAVCGPDPYEVAQNFAWHVEGRRKGAFRIHLERTSERGKDSIRVWWEPEQSS
jgi:hypothetical protein